MRRLLAVLMLFIMIASLALAQELRYDIYEFKLKYGSVLVLNEKIFSEPANLSTAIPIPKDARGVLVTVNLEPVELEIREEGLYKMLVINKTQIERMRLSYITELQPPDEFLITLQSIYPTNTLQASLTLAPEAVLDIPFVKAGGSMYPKPNTVDTDARSTIYIWERRKLKQGDELSLYVKFRQKTNLFLGAVLITLFMVILGFYLYYLRGQRSRGKHVK
ncbi:hypothetical protein HYV81_05715 [Candidatus Woesearchaeota archaeon]|nr:hypothetical protein [Candidatus Woesearchaeota archaeon]